MSAVRYNTLKTYNLHSCLLVLFCFGMSVASLSQTDTTAVDSSDTNKFFDATNVKVEYFSGDRYHEFIAVDTSLNSFQKFNPARKGIFQHTFLTNLGAAYQQKFFDFERTPGFDPGRDQFSIYLYDIDSLPYYRANAPFTDLYYVIGTNSEQLFHVRHTQNFGPQLNVALDLEKMTSEGFYISDKKSFTNFAFTTWYESKNKLYHVQGAFLYGNIRNTENGGVNSDSLFTVNNTQFGTDVFRTEANTNWKNLQGRIAQSYAFAKKKEYNIDDSTVAHYYAPYFEIQHSFSACAFDYLFEDPSSDTAYYGFIYADSDTLRDSSVVRGFSNKVSIGNPSFKMIDHDSAVSNKFRWNIFVLQQYHQFTDQVTTIFYHNLIAGAHLKHNFLSDSMFHYDLEVQYDISRKTYKAQGEIAFVSTNLNPSAGFIIAQLEPTVMQDHYYGFNSRWENNFSNIEWKKYYLQLSYPTWGTSVSVIYNDFKKYVFGDQGLQLSANDVSLFQIIAEQNFLVRNFHFRNRIGFQFSDKENILKIPAVISNHSFYYEKNLFNSALQMQAGMDIFYNSSYELYNYDIVTGIFYLQQYTFAGDEPANVFSGFYPTIDVFANFDIRTFRFFLKLENAAQGLLYDGYYEAVNYPMQNRSFKLGISWYLFY
ncbi:MAG: hypothetical protein H7X71_03775 [Chitinophagales bacterium]|nr:hypothetical protein [Chitinophagales bacterium]